jgi:hypothetical protein
VVLDSPEVAAFARYLLSPKMLGLYPCAEGLLAIPVRAWSLVPVSPAHAGIARRAIANATLNAWR